MSVTVSNPACGCGSPTVRSPISRRSSISTMNGSLRTKSSGDTTGAVRCPGPTNPGASGGTMTTRAILRCGFMLTSVDPDSRIKFERVVHVRKKSNSAAPMRTEPAAAAFAPCLPPLRKPSEHHKNCERKENGRHSRRLPATHLVANCQQHDRCKPNGCPYAEPRSDPGRHGQNDPDGASEF